MDLYGSYDPIGLTSDGMFDIAWWCLMYPATSSYVLGGEEKEGSWREGQSMPSIIAILLDTENDFTAWKLGGCRMPHVTPHDLAWPHVIPAYSCAVAAIFRLQECCKLLSVMGIHFKHGRRRPSERQQKLQTLGQIDSKPMQNCTDQNGKSYPSMMFYDVLWAAGQKRMRHRWVDCSPWRFVLRAF